MHLGHGQLSRPAGSARAIHGRTAGVDVPPLHLADPVQLCDAVGVRAAQGPDHRLRAVVRCLAGARRAPTSSGATRRWPPGTPSPPPMPICAARWPATGPVSCSPTTRASSGPRWRTWTRPWPRPPRCSHRRMELLAVPFEGLSLPGYLRVPARPAAATGGAAAARRRFGQGGAVQPGRPHRRAGPGGRRLRRSRPGAAQLRQQPAAGPGGGGTGHPGRAGRPARPGRQPGWRSVASPTAGCSRSGPRRPTTGSGRWSRSRPGTPRRAGSPRWTT